MKKKQQNKTKPQPKITYFSLNREYVVNDWPVNHPGLFKSKTKYADTNSKNTYKNSLLQKS